MPIDFTKFIKPTEVIVPIVNNSFTYHKKKYSITSPIGEGWWVVILENNKATPVNQVIEINNCKMDFLKGYTYHNQIVFSNSDSAKRKYSVGPLTPLHLNKATSFSAIIASYWEGAFYYVDIDYENFQIFEVKNAYDNGDSISEIKGLSPEIRSLYLFHELERQHLLELQRIEDKKRYEEELLKNIPDRLLIILKRAGAELLGYSISGNRLTFDWRLDMGKFTYNSVIDTNTWMMLECGFCMSGDDKRHNLTSMVKTAENYEENNEIFITRH